MLKKFLYPMIEWKNSFKKKILNYGNPVRNRFGKADNFKIKKFVKAYDINKNNKTILFLGGSLGSEVMNDFVMDNIDYFEKVIIMYINVETGIKIK